MSVFTEVHQHDLADLATHLSLGRIDSLQPVEGGVQNSNYFVHSEAGDWVLTLFEQMTAAQAQVYVDLLLTLRARGLPVPQPRCDAHGQALFPLRDKPALLVERSLATSSESVSLRQRQVLGGLLGRLHVAMRDWSGPAHPRGHGWRQRQLQQLMPHLTVADRELVSWAAEVDRRVLAVDLPQGGIHADLFRDNVLWHGEELALVLDFYVAGRDRLWLDLAICQHDWCRDAKGQLDPVAWQVFLQAYERERPLQDLERDEQVQKDMAVVAALRFFLSRSAAALAPPQAGVLVKNPQEYRRILQVLRSTEGL